MKWDRREAFAKVGGRVVGSGAGRRLVDTVDEAFGVGKARSRSIVEELFGGVEDR